jgi:hypothetical protein
MIIACFFTLDILSNIIDIQRMDGLVVSLITKHLTGKDLAAFACVSRISYQYCKSTNILIKSCKSVPCAYHFTPTLLQEAKLEYCLNKILDDVRTLAFHNIPISMYSTQVILFKPCGTKTVITIGRVLMINRLVFALNGFDVMCEFHRGGIPKSAYVLNIESCMERLRHKLNSIISNRYIDVAVRVTNKVQSDFKKSIVQGLSGIETLRGCIA